MIRLKKHQIVYLFCFTVTILTSSFAIGQTVTVKNDSISIANTKWSGTDSDGDFYEFHFLPDGHVAYKTNTERERTVSFRDEEDIWSQNGTKVIIALGNTSVQIGEIKDKEMKGTAWNKFGRTWTWSLKKLSK
ncbi:hypothetical protein [Kordia sp.]|uniref:hypothetical protein n=1 Tax=Kordia sp. TaxID=1965332 RepID=UPI003B59086E